MDQPRPSRRLILITVLCLFLFAGCSSTKMAYRYADWGIIWWVEDYITLTSAQEDQLSQDLTALQEWHCSAELPRYTNWLDELEADVSTGNPDPQTIRYHQQQLLAFIPDLLNEATPVAVNLLESLSDEQVAELAENMKKDQRELEEDMLAGTPQETAEARADRTAERVERWLGDLNREQRARVEDWSEGRAQQTEIWLQGRENWQEALLAALENRHQPGFEGTIEELLVHSDRARGPAYQAMMQESRQAMAELMHDLIQAGEKRHREHLLARARELNTDFVALSCL